MTSPRPPADVVPVAVVVVSWNSASVLARCLASAWAQGPSELVVVDNASTDASASVVRQTCPQARFVGLAANSGFAAASNLGAALTRAPFILFLNDDAWLLPDYLAILVAALQHQPRAASAIGKLVRRGRAPDIIDSAGIVLGAHALRPLDRGHGQPDVGQFDTPETIFGPSGAAALYRRAALEDGGPDVFDPAFFAYYEDVDLAWRLRRRGWTHLYEPRAVAVHGRRGPAAKSPDVAARAFANRYLVWRKNATWRRFAAYAPLAVPWETARLVRLGWRDPLGLARVARAVWTQPRPRAPSAPPPRHLG